MTVKFRDYYLILGIKQNAINADIKKAYRLKARQYHPDINPSPLAERKFKDVNEAYEVLGNSNRRGKYDDFYSRYKNGVYNSKTPTSRPQSTRPQSNYDGQSEQKSSSSGFSEFFDFLFGFGKVFRRPKRGEDIEVLLEVTIEEVFQNATKIIELHVQDNMGKGPYVRREKYEFKIPNGVREGARIRLRNQGGRGMSGGENGDLILKIHFAKHKLFTVSDFDLKMELPISPWQAVLGGDINVPTPSGPYQGKLPQGCEHGKIFRLRGRGLSTPNGIRGDLLIEVSITVPKFLSIKERKAYENLAKLYFTEN